jgi:hypothetical protein
VIRRALRWIDANPWSTLFIPPAIIVAQLAFLIALVDLGFPDHTSGSYSLVHLLLIPMFGLSFASLFGMALGTRQVLMLNRKVLPVVGIFLNGAYLLGFIFIFLFGIVLQNMH